jgi:hypothetical protein
MVSLFPLDVGHVQQREVIFDRESLELVKRKIAFHGLTKILNGSTQLI